MWLLTVKAIISVALILTLPGIAAWIIELSLPDKSVLLIALLRGSGLCIAVWGIIALLLVLLLLVLLLLVLLLLVLLLLVLLLLVLLLLVLLLLVLLL